MTCIALGLVLAAAPAAAGAAQGAAEERPVVRVIEVSGRIDPIVADFVSDSIRRASRVDTEVLVLQLNSPGAVISRAALDALVFRITHAEVPVGVWVGPSGARAYDGAYELVRAAPVAGMAPGTRIGGRRSPVFGPEEDGATFGLREARARDLVALDAPTLGDFIVDLDGRRVGDRTLQTARVVRTDDGPRREPTVVVSFSKLDLVPRLLHTVASPPVAFLLLVIGLLLIVFEFFTAGVGVAGVTGAAALALSAYGLDVLPTRPVGLALVVLAVFGFSVDVQAGAPRAWTVIGTAALAVAGLNFYRGLSVGLPAYGAALAGTVLFMVAGMPGVMRSRFSTPTIGRESMIGEQGLAVGALNPEGTVQVRGALWRARTNRATPIPGGDPVRVAAIDGVMLEVEPLEGAARDAGH